jgi:hypothetical protein
VLTDVEGQHACSSSGIKGGGPSGDELTTTASRQAEKNTASQDQTGKSSADNWAWDYRRDLRNYIVSGWGEICVNGIDPPPLKWSDLRYVFDIQEDCNGKEAIQA